MVVDGRRNGQTRQQGLQSSLHNNASEIYSIFNEGNSVVSEKLITTLKNKISKYIAIVSKYGFIKKLDETFVKCNNKYLEVKIKTVDDKSGIYIDVVVGHNDKDPESKVGDYGKIEIKKLLQSENLRMLCHRRMLLLISTVKKLSERKFEMTS